jgi:hypothetical protein
MLDARSGLARHRKNSGDARPLRLLETAVLAPAAATAFGVKAWGYRRRPGLCENAHDGYVLAAEEDQNDAYEGE